jgi:hypothetical protein
MLRIWKTFAACLLTLTVVGAGCSSDDADAAASGGTGANSGGTGANGTGGSSAGTGTDGSLTDSPWTTTPEGQVDCGGGVACLCHNGIDDDGDDLIDGFDPECTGPFDDDEGSYATGIPGDNQDPKWQDCFFDGNSGAGDDGCRYHTDCLTGDLPATDASCTVTQQCIDFCGERTPNGCDCFGCCEATNNAGEAVFIMLAPTCSLDNIDDERACPRCVQTATCGNDCGRCELCPGKTEADLPADCLVDGGTYTCDNATVCAANTDCPVEHYCQFGCCTPFVF